MFETRVQTSTNAGSSGTVVPSSSVSNMQAVGTLIQGLTPAVQGMFQAPSQDNEVKNLVNSRIQDYQRVKDEKGTAAAERWMSKKFQEDLSTLNSTGKSIYKDSFKSTFGESPIKSERDRELALIEQQEKEALEERDAFIDSGRLVVIGLGLNPDEVGDDDLVRYGEKRAADQAALELKSKQLAVRSQQATLDATDAQKATDMIQTTIRLGLSTDLDIGMQELTKTVQNDPARAESLKADYISRLSLQIARAETDYMKAVQEAGGDPRLVPQSSIEGYKNELKASRDFLNSEHIKSRTATQVAIAQNDAILSLRAQDPVAYGVVTLAPQAASVFGNVIKSALSTGEQRDSTDSTMRVLSESVTGPAQARVRHGSTTSAPYKVLASAFDTAAKMNPDVREEYVTKGAEMVSTALLESMSPLKAVRAQANSSTGMHEAIKVMRARNISDDEVQAIRVAVEDNGISLEDAMQGRLRTFIQESLLPSLRAPALSDAQDVPYTVQVQGSALRLEPKLSQERPSSEFAGIASAVGNRQYRQRLKQMERVLNDEIQVYSKLTGGSAEELNLVIQQALGIRQGIEDVNKDKEDSQG